MALFGGEGLPDEASYRADAAIAAIGRSDVNDLLAGDLETLVEQFTAPFEPVTIHWANATMSEPQQFTSEVDDWSGRRIRRTVLRSTMTVPVSGEALVLTYRSYSGYPGATIEGEVRNGAVSFTWTGQMDATSEQILAWSDQRRQEVERFLAYNNGDLDRLNREMRAAVRAAIETRRDQELKRRALAAKLPFPVERRPDAALPVHVQRTPVRLSPLQQRSKVAPFEPEPELDRKIYEEIIRDCVAMATIFERMPVAATIGEEELRNLILAMLNTNYSGQVAGELFNGSGKTDILVRVDDRNVFIGECKFYKGPKSVENATDQLLLYSVWRDTKAALLLFVRGGNFTEVVAKATQAVGAHSQCQRRVASRDPSRRSDFVFARADDPGRAIHLAVLPFQLTG